MILCLLVIAIPLKLRSEVLLLTVQIFSIPRSTPEITTRNSISIYASNMILAERIHWLPIQLLFLYSILAFVLRTAFAMEATGIAIPITKPGLQLKGMIQMRP